MATFPCEPEALLDVSDEHVAAVVAVVLHLESSRQHGPEAIGVQGLSRWTRAARLEALEGLESAHTLRSGWST